VSTAAARSPLRRARSTAQEDFDALVQAAMDKTVKSEGVILVQKAPEQRAGRAGRAPAMTVCAVINQACGPATWSLSASCLPGRDLRRLKQIRASETITAQPGASG